MICIELPPDKNSESKGYTSWLLVLTSSINFPHLPIETRIISLSNLYPVEKQQRYWSDLPSAPFHSHLRDSGLRTAGFYPQKLRTSHNIPCNIFALGHSILVWRGEDMEDFALVSKECHVDDNLACHLGILETRHQEVFLVEEKGGDCSPCFLRSCSAKCDSVAWSET